MERNLTDSHNPFSRESRAFARNSSTPSFTYHNADQTPDQFPVDEKRPERALLGSQGNSAASSIAGGKEGHGDVENGHGHGDDLDIFDPSRPKFGLRKRLHHFTWAWFTLPMSTGGLSLLIFAQPHQFPGLRQIGLFVYIVNLILFTVLTCTMLARFFLHHGDFYRSLSHPREGFFFPTYFLSVATIITSTQRYAIPANDTALIWAIQTAFWGYVVVTLILAVGQYSFVFAKHSFGLQTMMPTWILPIFPIMLSGTIAAVISDTQPDIAAIHGWSSDVSRYVSIFLKQIHHSHPGLFMNVGPPAFTALAFIGMANGLPDNFDRDMDGFIDVNLIRTFAIIGAIFLWALSLWWFFIAVIAVVSSPPKYFHLGWWAMVFPNTGFILATISIANEFGNDAVKWVTTGMSICLFAMYCFVLFHHIRAVIVQDIMYPGRDEDVEDH